MQKETKKERNGKSQVWRHKVRLQGGREAPLSLPPPELAARLWEIYPFICRGHARTHPTTHHFYFILRVSHSTGWLNRIMSPTIIINQNYGLKNWGWGNCLPGYHAGTAPPNRAQSEENGRILHSWKPWWLQHTGRHSAGFKHDDINFKLPFNCTWRNKATLRKSNDINTNGVWMLSGRVEDLLCPLKRLIWHYKLTGLTDFSA